MAEEIYDRAEGVVVPFPKMKREKPAPFSREKSAHFAIDDGAKWHPSGFSPVYIGFVGSTAPLFMIGFTTLQCLARRFMLSRAKDDPEHGQVHEFYGEARRVVVGSFYGWSMIRGDAADMPNFWPI
jgi:hypothetical protein